MTRREELRDNYEDALFALLMDEFAEREGERLLEENERLKLDPDIVISDELDRRCIKTIAKGKRRKVKYAAYRMISRVAVAVLAVVVLFGTAYAAFPEVRIRTLNLIIELSDQAASLTMGGANNSMQNDDGASAELNEDGTLRGYRLPEIPEGTIQTQVYLPGFDILTLTVYRLDFLLLLQEVRLLMWIQKMPRRLKIFLSTVIVACLLKRARASTSLGQIRIKTILLWFPAMA